MADPFRLAVTGIPLVVGGTICVILALVGDAQHGEHCSYALGHIGLPLLMYGIAFGLVGVGMFLWAQADPLQHAWIALPVAGMILEVIFGSGRYPASSEKSAVYVMCHWWSPRGVMLGVPLVVGIAVPALRARLRRR